MNKCKCNYAIDHSKKGDGIAHLSNSLKYAWFPRKKREMKKYEKSFQNSITEISLFIYLFILVCDVKGTKVFKMQLLFYTRGHLH